MLPELNTVVGLLVNIIGFPSHGIGYPGFCHQVSLIGAIDENQRMYDPPGTRLRGAGLKADGLNQTVL